MNFSQTGTRTATDSLLCPNKTYTFHCEISGDSLQLTSFDINGSAVDIFFVFSETATEGKTINQTDFNFTGFNSANGSPVAASAVMDSSTGLSSVKLECRDLSDDDLTSLSTVVKCKCGKFNYCCCQHTVYDACACFSPGGIMGLL